MATIPELKDEAVKLGLTGISKLKKADLETLISAARDEARQAESAKADARQAESVTVTTNEAVPSDPKAVRRALADAAGKRATVTSPMSNARRALAYDGQRLGAVTPAMARRMRKAENRALKTA